MSERMKESLSALMDGEANELELQRVLRDSGDPDLRATWTRYNRISRIMREGRDEAYWQLDISSRVSQAISGEAEVGTQPEEPRRWRGVLRPMASFAVATSVFAAVLVGGQLYGLVGVSPDDDTSLAGRVSPVGLVNTMGGTAQQANYGPREVQSQRMQRQAAYDKLARQRLERYILPHTEHAALKSPQGMMPYARVTAQRAREQ